MTRTGTAGRRGGGDPTAAAAASPCLQGGLERARRQIGMGDEGKGREMQDDDDDNVQATTGGKGNKKEAQVTSTTSLGP